LPYLHQGRAIRLLKASKELEVLWTMTDAAREEVLLPIRIPLLKGLMGYRIFIIRQEDQVKFRDINTLAQLRKLIAGQGHDWPDTQILRANKLKVTTSSSYIGLFEMLQSKRFDYFPRSITEAQSEQPLYQPKGLITEDSLLLHYIAPFYFFVALANTTLAKRLETGLQIALEDGSFDILLNSYFLDQAGPDWLKDKKVLHLKNPLLPPLTPVDNEQLWYR
ncbi:MAG: hypothetical protein HRT35_13865, partial [Algicola sp.]|nr:hypothetical protein [Algicola sp.]